MIVSAMFGALAGAGMFLALPRSRDAATDVVARILTDGRSRPPSGSISPRDGRELVEAIASWAEQVRDTISASGGLVQALSATASTSPPVLEPHVRKLAADLGYVEPTVALRRFADNVDHQTCDFVVAALLAAQRHPVRDLSQVLGHLAECAREESRAHLRIWVGRARTRRAVRIISSVVALFLVGLFVSAPDYMSPFLTGDGALVGLAVTAMFAGAFWRLAQLARLETAHRLLDSRSVARP